MSWVAWTFFLARCQLLPAAVAGGEESCAQPTGDSVLKWLSQQGGVVDGIEVKAEGVAGRGVFATRALPEGHVVLQVPPGAIVTSPLAADTVLGRAILREAQEGTLPDFRLEGLLLTSWLLERSEDADWEPYFASLPSDFSSILNASTGELEVCGEGLELGTYLQDMRSLLRMEHEHLQKHGVAWPRYLWARLLSFSRTFTFSRMAVRSHSLAFHKLTGRLLPELSKLPGVSDKESSVLIPGLDLINHGDRTQVSCSWTLAGDRGMLLQTLKPVEAGSELFVSYGDKANDVFLTHYGFVLPRNRKEVLKVPLQLPGASPSVLTIQGDVVMSRQDFDAILTLARDATRADDVAATEKEHEIAALRALKTALSSHRDQLQPRDGCPEICRTYRAGLTDLLDTWQRFLENALRVLSGSELVTSDADASDPLRLHSRLYFGLWLSSRGHELVDDAIFMHARPWGRVRYFDID